MERYQPCGTFAFGCVTYDEGSKGVANEMARPKKAISASQVESLAKIGCTVSEIAAVMKCDKRTLERRFAAVIQRGRERLKESLRRH